ncbi:hypothetical protein NM688_g5464 [Phlebia brevispora]|uniref:Uncharacterized protein n=1 Tax=Phlebia brevispora TaxID=194682 RepID=A0ACC1SUQ6_9APHY|nr:hypothetical protein NM688_g5464 [Phlebia brevispora]
MDGVRVGTVGCNGRDRCEAYSEGAATTDGHYPSRFDKLKLADGPLSCIRDGFDCHLDDGHLITSKEGWEDIRVIEGRKLRSTEYDAYTSSRTPQIACTYESRFVTGYQRCSRRKALRYYPPACGGPPLAYPWPANPSEVLYGGLRLKKKRDVPDVSADDNWKFKKTNTSSFEENPAPEDVKSQIEPDAPDDELAALEGQMREVHANIAEKRALQAPIVNREASPIRVPRAFNNDPVVIDLTGASD